MGLWQQTLTSGGQRSLRGAPSTGRPPLLDANDQKRLIAALKAGALAQGYSSDLWTLGRVGKLIETLTGQRYCESGVWRLLKRLGFSSQRPAKVRCSAMRRLFGNGRPSAGRRSKRMARPVCKMNLKMVLKVCANVSGLTSDARNQDGDPRALVLIKGSASKHRFLNQAIRTPVDR